MRTVIFRFGVFLFFYLLTNCLTPVELYENRVYIYGRIEGGSFFPHGILELVLGIIPRTMSSIFTDNFNVYNRSVFQATLVIQCLIICHFSSLRKQNEAPRKSDLV